MAGSGSGDEVKECLLLTVVFFMTTFQNKELALHNVVVLCGGSSVTQCLKDRRTHLLT